MIEINLIKLIMYLNSKFNSHIYNYNLLFVLVGTTMFQLTKSIYYSFQSIHFLEFFYF